MDSIKTAIAHNVSQHIHAEFNNQRVIRGRDTDQVIAVDVTDLTPLVCQIRVKTRSQGTRYFYVTLREQM